MKARTENSSTEQTLENLRSLIAEAESAISGDLAEKSEETLANLRARLQEGLDSLNGYYAQTKRRVAEGARRTDETIRAHPYESLAVALGVGVLIGALVRRQ